MAQQSPKQPHPGKAPRRNIYLEDLCFNAQQAVEKAVKAVLIAHEVEFPYVHDITELLTTLEKAGQKIPPSIRQAERLTRFAISTRYPGIVGAIRREEYQEALTVAERVIRWARTLVREKVG